MNPTDNPQPELDFGTLDNGTRPPRDGLAWWREQRRAMVKKVGWELGLPLDRQVEVWLRGGVRLRGQLKLREEVLFVAAPRDLNLELVVDGVTFRWTEIESCVRTD